MSNLLVQQMESKKLNEEKQNFSIEKACQIQIPKICLDL